MSQGNVTAKVVRLRARPSTCANLSFEVGGIIAFGINEQTQGVLVGEASEGDSIRLECEVWVENQRGQKVIVGKASGLVPA